MTPFEKRLQRKPNLSHLRVFGSRVIVQKQGKRPSKLNKHNNNGFFLRFRSNPRNIVYFDEKTQNEQQAKHLEFDEAHYAYNHHPLYPQQLRDIYEAKMEKKGIENKAPLVTDKQ